MVDIEAAVPYFSATGIYMEVCFGEDPYKDTVLALKSEGCNLS